MDSAIECLTLDRTHFWLACRSIPSTSGRKNPFCHSDALFYRAIPVSSDRSLGLLGFIRLHHQITVVERNKGI